jgi:hypothetical protein
VEHPGTFLALLRGDLAWLEHVALKQGLKPACRMNITSDIAWETVDDLLDGFPEIEFYDYTKVRGRRPPPNYSLTFSRSEKNGTLVEPTLGLQQNVAVVFRGPTLPASYLGYPVIDGDSDDCRFLDPRPVVVGLRAKGTKAKNDSSGFVLHVTPDGETTPQGGPNGT